MSTTRSLISNLRLFGWCFVLLSLVLATGCGGGGGGGGSGSSGGGSTTNQPPTISNLASTHSVAENQTAVTTVSASDPEGASLTYSLTGTDASLLSIGSSGALTFNTAPDYETKNSYSFSVSVSDGTLTASQSLTVNISNINEPPTLSANAISMDENIALIPGLTLTDPEGDDLSVLVYPSRGHATDLEGLENEVLGNEDGSVLIINQDTAYDSTKIIKLVSEIQLAKDVTLTLNGSSIYSPVSIGSKRIEVWNGHLVINETKARNIFINFCGSIHENGTSTPGAKDDAGTIKITNSSFKGGALAERAEPPLFAVRGLVVSP
jgi:hypothetical protein